VGLPRFAVVDVETSGLRPRRHHVLQIGVVIVEGDRPENQRVVDRWSTLVRLRRFWHRVGPRHVHGITRRALRHAAPPSEALAELARRIDGAVFTAHNAVFDAMFLQRAAERSGVTLTIDRRLCTLDLSRRLDPERSLAHGLADLCGRYGVPLTEHHDALADASATAAVLPRLLHDLGITEASQLDDLYFPRRAVPRTVLGVDPDPDVPVQV
jgi:DNA polymerase-3 subunit epsilon